MSSIPDWTLVATAGAIKARKVSAVEVVDVTMARIAARQPALNAFVRIDAEGARAEAEAADARQASGQVLGPLHGVPLAHKDMFYRPGVPVMCGSVVRDFWPDYLATVLARLDTAGAVTVGALNVGKFDEARKAELENFER